MGKAKASHPSRWRPARRAEVADCPPAQPRQWDWVPRSRRSWHAGSRRWGWLETTDRRAPTVGRRRERSRSIFLRCNTIIGPAQFHPG
eukprot:scaffold1453_cov112-Isochrysis_galbana.AAC.15